jgi:soluble lytic murein transglycosylase-like protein
VLCLLALCLAAPSRADEQREPELKELLQKIIASRDCFSDMYESEVWHKAMEPKLTRYVASYEQRIEILDQVYCEAKRDPSLALPPDLVLALIDVESRFDNWAVSPVGAVCLSGRGSSAPRISWYASRPISAWVARFCASICAPST